MNISMFTLIQSKESRNVLRIRFSLCSTALAMVLDHFCVLGEK